MGRKYLGMYNWNVGHKLKIKYLKQNSHTLIGI